VAAEASRSPLEKTECGTEESGAISGRAEKKRGKVRRQIRGLSPQAA